MVRVINNNLWTPVPWGFGCGGHSCGGNNWMQKMFGYQMLFNMMQNIGRCYATPPQQQGGFYPGLYLGGGGGGAAMPQNYEEYLQQQQDAQSLTELKSAYSEFNIRKIGDRYFAYLKSDKTQRIEADSVDELMDGLNEYVDQNPDKFKAKPAKAETSNEETVDNTSTGNDNTTTGTEGAGAPATSNNNNSNAASNNSANPNTGVKVPQGWHHNINQAWITENFTNKNITTPTAEQIMLAFNGNNKLNIGGINAENKAKLLNDLRQYNPSCFNSDGTGKSPFPWDKLDIPGPYVLKNTYGVPEKAKAPAAPDKTHKYIIRLVFNDQKGVASTVSPDGQLITYNYSGYCPDQIKNYMIEQLKAKGFSNVVIRCDGPGMNKGATSDSNFDKTAQYTVMLQYDKTNGIAGVILPDGSKVTYASSYPPTAGNYTHRNIVQQIKNNGWTNTKVVWNSDCFFDD